MATAPKRVSDDPEVPPVQPGKASVTEAARVDASSETPNPTPTLNPTVSSAERGSPEVAPTAYTHKHPTAEEIAAEAYAIYIAQGRQHGSDLDHWLEAERRLRVRGA